MSARVAIAGQTSNRGDAHSDTKKGPIGTATAAVLRVAQGLFASKVVQNVIAETGASESTVKRWKSGRREMGVEDFAKLLRTEEGVLYLTAVMAESQPTWWQMFCAHLDKADAQRLQAQARNRLRRAVTRGLDADAALTAAINRAEVLAFQDPEFSGAHVDALRSFGRVPNSAMAQTKVRSK